MAAIALRRFPPIQSLLSLGLGLSRLAGVGLVAIGISGAVSLAAGAAFGKDFVSGDPPGVTYTAERCAELIGYYPEGTCRTAATAHHFAFASGCRPPGIRLEPERQRPMAQRRNRRGADRDLLCLTFACLCWRRAGRHLKAARGLDR